MTDTHYILISFIVLVVIYFQGRKLYLHKTSIGKKFILDYFDQNNFIEEFLPREGIITRRILIDGTRMFVLTLKKEFSYLGRTINELVLIERHAGHYIGDDNDVHVHIAVPLIELNKEKYSINEFSHDAWGILNRI